MVSSTRWTEDKRFGKVDFTPKQGVLRAGQHVDVKITALGNLGSVKVRATAEVEYTADLPVQIKGLTEQEAQGLLDKGYEALKALLDATKELAWKLVDVLRSLARVLRALAALVGVALFAALAWVLVPVIKILLLSVVFAAIGLAIAIVVLFPVAKYRQHVEHMRDKQEVRNQYPRE